MDLRAINEMAQWIVLVWILLRLDGIVAGLRNHKRVIEALARRSAQALKEKT